MEKQTKNILTRKFIEDELRFLAKADKRASIATCLGFTPLCVCLALIMFWAASELPLYLIVKVIFCTVFPLICLLPIIAMILSVIKASEELKMLDQGEYDIITKELSYKSEECRRRGKNDRIVRLLHFPDFEPIEVNSTTYQLASNDDVFYFVVYRKKSAQPSLFYHSKMYEFKEE